ncbi:MAG TPA: hypothetical protein IAB67_06240 [Candidatus Ventrousia excrementavium]|uniref:Head fiber protein n=1 Tax=Candidatus Ventrousia excrementavium TaxID=2840961 RepID=A0A9D1IV06_9CLOT|nr:hypothetical protein [Candidatus Ventrousia excrementavium]
MPLTPQTIGLNMSHGFAGSYARQPDMIVNTAPLGGTAAVLFGTPLVRGQGGAVVPMGTGNTGSQFIGVAGREVKSATEFFSQQAGQYAPDEPVSVFQRGCINVRCQKGAPVIDGTVYVRVTASGDYPAGGFEAEADGENTVALLNAQWGGPADNNGVAELRIAYVGPVMASGTASGGDMMADGSVPMTGALNMGGNKVTNTAEPTDDTDAATKEYVDDTITVALVGNYIPAGEKGAASGVATLDANSKVPAAQLPAASAAIGGVKQMAAIADLTAAPTMEDFNNLLAALRTAGMLAQS